MSYHQSEIFVPDTLSKIAGFALFMYFIFKMIVFPISEFFFIEEVAN